jgi:hypothetical protein
MIENRGEGNSKNFFDIINKNLSEFTLTYFLYCTLETQCPCMKSNMIKHCELTTRMMYGSTTCNLNFLQQELKHTSSLR